MLPTQCNAQCDKQGLRGGGWWEGWGWGSNFFFFLFLLITPGCKSHLLALTKDLGRIIYGLCASTSLTSKIVLCFEKMQNSEAEAQQKDPKPQHRRMG